MDGLQFIFMVFVLPQLMMLSCSVSEISRELKTLNSNVSRLNK